MFTVIKSHKVESGETSSSVKFDTMEESLRSYHQFAANYMADTSVLAWSLAIVQSDAGRDMRMVKRESYAVPMPEPVEDVETDIADEQ